MTRFDRQTDNLLGMKFKSSAWKWSVVKKERENYYTIICDEDKQKLHSVSKDTILHYFNMYGGW